MAPSTTDTLSPSDTGGLPLSDQTLKKSFEEVQEVQLDDVSPLLEESSPTLHELMASIEKEGGGDSLFFASYRYGATMVDEGRFKAPCGYVHGEGGMCPCSRMWDRVNYPIPLSIMLSGTAEAYDTVEFVAPNGGTERHAVPLRLLGRGAIFGDFESLDDLNFEERLPPPSWSVSAGARSVYLQLRTGSQRFWDELRSRLDDEGAEDLHRSLQSLQEQPDHRLIRYITRRHPETRDWSSHVLIVPTKWFDGDGMEKQRLRHFLYQKAWVKSRNLRHKVSRTADYFEDIREKDRYYTPFLRYLLLATRADLPVFRPCTASPDSPMGPFFQVQEFLDSVVEEMGSTYHYQDYYPSVLEPTYLHQKGDVGYASLRIPTFENPIDVSNFSADYARPTADFFSPIAESKKKERMNRFDVDELRVYHSADETGDVLRSNESIVENHLDDFIPDHRSEKSLMLHNGSFLSTSVRIVRS